MEGHAAQQQGLQGQQGNLGQQDQQGQGFSSQPQFLQQTQPPHPHLHPSPPVNSTHAHATTLPPDPPAGSLAASPPRPAPVPHAAAHPSPSHLSHITIFKKISLESITSPIAAPTASTTAPTTSTTALPARSGTAPVAWLAHDSTLDALTAALDTPNTPTMHGEARGATAESVSKVRNANTPPRPVITLPAQSLAFTPGLPAQIMAPSVFKAAGQHSAPSVGRSEGAIIRVSSEVPNPAEREAAGLPAGEHQVLCHGAGALLMWGSFRCTEDVWILLSLRLDIAKFKTAQGQVQAQETITVIGWASGPLGFSEAGLARPA